MVILIKKNNIMENKVSKGVEKLECSYITSRNSNNAAIVENKLAAPQ